VSAVPDLTVRAISATIAGRVQGVGFRWSALAEARRRDVSGWVRNRSDGSVEALVQGDPAAVAAYVAWLHDGPPGARVTSVEIDEIPPDPALSDFTILNTDI
jgi:acylphosphatase